MSTTTYAPSAGAHESVDTGDNIDGGIETESNRIEEKIDEREHPWRDPEILTELYWSRGLSQREIASWLGCAQDTVHRWMDEYRIERRSSRRSNDLPSLTSVGEGYTKVVDHYDGGEKTIRLSQLVAIANGADPYQVLSKDARDEDDEDQDRNTDEDHGDFVCHHRLDTGLRIDFPSNIVVIERTDHNRLHRNGYDPDIEAVLDRKDREDQED